MLPFFFFTEYPIKWEKYPVHFFVVMNNVTHSSKICQTLNGIQFYHNNKNICYKFSPIMSQHDENNKLSFFFTIDAITG